MILIPERERKMKTAHWIYSHYALNTYKAKCSNCGYEEKVCDDLERKNCPKCKAVMSAQYQKMEENEWYLYLLSEHL